jgi:hypothetical protein
MADTDPSTLSPARPPQDEPPPSLAETLAKLKKEREAASRPLNIWRLVLLAFLSFLFSVGLRFCGFDVGEFLMGKPFGHL